MKKFEYHVLQYSKGINSESDEISRKDLEQFGKQFIALWNDFLLFS